MAEQSMKYTHCMYVCMYEYIYIYIYTHTHTHTLMPGEKEAIWKYLTVVGVAENSISFTENLCLIN